MASLRETLDLRADEASVWDAVRDFGALHTRLVRGFVVDTRLEGTARAVTFANGLTVTEQLVGADDAQRRLAYAIAGGRFTHYQGTVEVQDTGDGRTRLVWTVDLLPDSAAEAVQGMMRQGAEAMRATLEAS